MFNFVEQLKTSATSDCISTRRYKFFLFVLANNTSLPDIFDIYNC